MNKAIVLLLATTLYLGCAHLEEPVGVDPLGETRAEALSLSGASRGVSTTVATPDWTAAVPGRSRSLASVLDQLGRRLP